MGLADAFNEIYNETKHLLNEGVHEAKEKLGFGSNNVLACENVRSDLYNKLSQATVGIVNLNSSQLSLIQNALNSNNCKQMKQVDKEINHELSR